jgi:hypothetical protein
MTTVSGGLIFAMLNHQSVTSLFIFAEQSSQGTWTGRRDERDPFAVERKSEPRSGS